MTENKEECLRPKCGNMRVARARGYCEKHAYAEGVFKPFVDSSKAQAIVTKLHDMGHTYLAIAEAAGTSQQAIHNTKKATYPTVRGRLYEGILQAEQVLSAADPITRNRPAWHIRRRLQALAAIGHSSREISAATGVSVSLIGRIRSGERARVRRGAELAILAYYKQHEGDAARPVTPQLRHHNWPKPMDWDNIDNPEETPTNTPEKTPGWNDVGEVTGQDRENAAKIINFYGTSHKAARASTISQDILAKISNGTRTTCAIRTLQKIADHMEDINIGAATTLRDVA